MNVFEQTRLAKQKSILLATAPTNVKNAMLLAIADSVEKSADDILSANAIDIEKGANMTPVMRDRLLLTPDRIKRMADGVRDLIDLPDPVGRVDRKSVV